MQPLDSDIDEKRVYTETDSPTFVYIAAATGLVCVKVAGALAGEFSLIDDRSATDVAVSRDRLVLATSEDVFVARNGRSASTEFKPTEFGPATAVDSHDGIVAAGEGRIAQYTDAWTPLGHVDSVRAITGNIAATATGVHRLDGTHVGLNEAYDVTTATGPYVATSTGLFLLANGWMNELDGQFRAVSSRPGGTVLAAASDRVYRREDTSASWQTVDAPVTEPVAAIAVEDAEYIVTVDGTIAINAGDGWRTRSLGIQDVAAVAAIPS